MDPLDDKELYALRPRQVPIDEVLPTFFHDVEDSLFVDEEGHLTKTFRPPSSQRLRSGIEIPSVVQILQDDDTNGRFVRPKKYIKEAPVPEPYPEYDLDDDDEELIAAINELNGAKSKKSKGSPKPLDDDAFERVIDWLEKETFFKSHEGIPVTLDDSKVVLDKNYIPCSICGELSQDDNPVVFCNTCRVAVHPYCYGIKLPPAGTPWLCRKCSSSDPKSVVCIFCPNTSGAFMQVKDAWYHILCAAACPVAWMQYQQQSAKGASANKRTKKTRVSSPRGSTSASNAPGEHFEALCDICEKTRGVCINCAEKGCEHKFHITCASTIGYYIQRTITAAKTKNQRGTPTGLTPSQIQIRCFCRRHSLKPEYLSNRSQVFVPLNLSESEVEALHQKYTSAKRTGLPKLDARTLELLFRHWVMKRYVQGHELIHRLRVTAADVAKTERQRQKLAKMKDDLQKMIKLRQHLERVRILVDLCKKREMMKRQALDALGEVLDAIAAEQNENKAVSSDRNHSTSNSATTTTNTPNSRKRKRPNR